MPKFLTALICVKGHVLTSCLRDNQHFLQITYCEKCGSEIISACPSCHQEILGCEEFEYESWVYKQVEAYYDENKFSLPAYCHYCGKPYPWTEFTIQTFEEIIDMSDELDEVDKTILKEKFPQILTNSPGTSAAALRISKTLKTASNITVQALRSAVASKIVGHALELLGWK